MTRDALGLVAHLTRIAISTYQQLYVVTFYPAYLQARSFTFDRVQSPSVLKIERSITENVFVLVVLTLMAQLRVTEEIDRKYSCPKTLRLGTS